MGDNCRFNHDPNFVPNNQVATGTGQNIKLQSLDTSTDGITLTPTSERVARRPFLKIVVLYASDSRVLRYAKEVQLRFLDNGIDVCLQTEVEQNQTTTLEVNLKDTEIKTENLAELITSSTNSDFLVVIGDRNMKNQSCQVKKKGKLVEMALDHMIICIWQEWSPYQTQFADIDFDASLSDVIFDLNDEQLYIILARYFPQFNLDTISKKASNLIDEINTWKRPNNLPEFPETEIITISPSSDLFDETKLNKLNSAQKLLIRIHKQCVHAKDVLESLPECPEENFIFDQNQFGNKVGPDYDPIYALTTQISEVLRERLIDLILSIFDNVEEEGQILSEFNSPLWKTYITQYNSNLKSGATLEESDNSKEWICSMCTAINQINLKTCHLCSNSRKVEDDNDEWETIGEKKKRKQNIKLEETKNKGPIIQQTITEKSDSFKLKNLVKSSENIASSNNLNISNNSNITNITNTTNNSNNSHFNYPSVNIQNPPKSPNLSFEEKKLPKKIIEEKVLNESKLQKFEYQSQGLSQNSSQNSLQGPSQSLSQALSQNPLLSDIEEKNQTQNKVSNQRTKKLTQLKESKEFIPSNSYIYEPQNTSENHAFDDNKNYLIGDSYYESNNQTYEKFQNYYPYIMQSYENNPLYKPNQPLDSFSNSLYNSPKSFPKSTESYSFTSYNSQYPPQRYNQTLPYEMPTSPTKNILRPNIKHPCSVCGAESTIECNLCAKMGLKTLFCCIKHQVSVWKEHTKKLHSTPYFSNELLFSQEILNFSSFSQ